MLKNDRFFPHVYWALLHILLRRITCRKVYARHVTTGEMAPGSTMSSVDMHFVTPITDTSPNTLCQWQRQRQKAIASGPQPHSSPAQPAIKPIVWQFVKPEAMQLQYGSERQILQRLPCPKNKFECLRNLDVCWEAKLNKLHAWKCN